jgi:hypothetical protein
MWLIMGRLAATGLLRFTQEARVLHRSTAFAEVNRDAGPLDRRAGDLKAEAERALRMAKVLASGGFPEEAAMPLVKAVQKAGAALMAERAELAAGTLVATDADIRRLVEKKALPIEALDVLAANRSDAKPADTGKIDALLPVMEHVLAALQLRETRAAA